MSDIARIRERLRQARAVRAREVLGTHPKAECPEGRIGCRYEPGTRVFDRVTGEEGEVIGGTRENVVLAAPDRSDG